MTIFVAVDIGASSGRLIKTGSHPTGQLVLEEIHRFKNGFSKVGQHDYWAIDHLVQDILVGLQKLKQDGVTDCILGIDTWAVDYCLMDKVGQLLQQPIAYRDERTSQAVAAFKEKMPLETLYGKTGIQIQPFNTLFQLFVEDRALLDQADKLLLIPDYLGYVLTGQQVMEKTNASTMQLLNVATQTWDKDLLAILGISEELLPPLVDAGNVLGELQSERFPEFDLPKVTVVNVASHDTASAVLGTPAVTNEEWAYISSGTWSLLGIETKAFDVSQTAFQENYTNEWGAHNTIRFLKNIMGMWLIQEVARGENYQHSYPEMAALAAEVPAFQRFIDVNADKLLNPDDMSNAIQVACLENGQTAPETTGELARTIYDNLALYYAVELEKLGQLASIKDKIKTLHIVGGGANNDFLNQLTADVTGLEVIAGPSEATAVGNIIMQQIAVGQLASIQAGRQLIAESFDFKHYQPSSDYQEVVQTYKNWLGENK
ncbi:rhamnulokinase [Pseudolactococcus yaeyamensis]